jgi:orotidine-5'-phosphate decarboxylase
VRAAHGGALELLVPGLRLDTASADDQARVATPAEAVAAGANYLVLGRAVTAAADPRAAMRRVKEMLR